MDRVWYDGLYLGDAIKKAAWSAEVQNWKTVGKDSKDIHTLPLEEPLLVGHIPSHRTWENLGHSVQFYF